MVANDLISRQAAIDAMWEGMPGLTFNEALKRLRELPTAEKKGTWIGIDDEPCEVWECDKCGHIVEVDATLKLPNYCENCGARMEET